MQIVKYKPARFGLGTESSKFLQPLDFSPDIQNRYYSLLGDLQKRPGMAQLGAQITSVAGTAVSAQIINLHEYTDTSGRTTLFASGITDTGSVRNSQMWRYNVSASSWDSLGLTKDPDKKIYSVQMNDKLIFCNGTDRNFYIDKPAVGISAGYTQQLYSTVTKGITAGGTNSITLFDNDISNWRTQTNVAVNDFLMVFINSALVGGVVTSVGTSSLDILNIGTSANGIGVAASNLTSGIPYRIVDLVELNVIPNASPGGTIFDNVAVAGASTTSTVIGVTALNFSTTDARPGDYIYNTTRAGVAIITTVSSNINIGSTVSGQVPGDSIIFLKDAMPITSYPHVHYGRLHLIDARDQTKIRVSGPNDPEDFSTFSKTLVSTTIDYGSRQPRGDILLSMDTFQRYLVVGGQQAVYVTDGTNPIADVTADVIDLDPAGLFPQGIVSPNSLRSIGNEMLYLANDGLRSFLAAFDSKNTTTNNKSEQIKTQLIDAISRLLSSPNLLHLVHYPRRNWVIMKIGETMYNYNYTQTYQLGQFQSFGTITNFTGTLASQISFLVRRNGDLITGGPAGRVYQFDSGTTDAGAVIPTRYVSPWHTFQEGTNDLTLIIKDGRYIKPIFETYDEIKYTISVIGDYDRLATDTVIVTAQGAAVIGISIVGTAIIGNSTITEQKTPLRWRGEQFQITIETSSQSGNDIVNSYTIYGNIFGRK